MRSYAVWLQWGHTTSCSFCTLSPSPSPTHFTVCSQKIWSWISWVLCHVMDIKSLCYRCCMYMFWSHITESTNWTYRCTRSLLSCLYFSQNTFSLFALSRTHTFWHWQIVRGEEDRWHISWGEAAKVICYNSALISIFSNLLKDLYVLLEKASILTEPWLASTAPVSHDRCFPWPPDIFGGSHGPLSSLVNFALWAPLLLAYEYPHSHTYSTAMHGDFKKWPFLGGNWKDRRGRRGGRSGWGLGRMFSQLSWWWIRLLWLICS